MADVTIPGLTALTSIDRAADLFEVSDTSDSNNSKKTTINNMLNITSQPLALTDTQSPTNKTFDNSNILTLRDDRFTLQDNSDTTKQAVLQLSGITTGTTRTYTLPDRSSTLATLGGDQTFTGTNVFTGGTFTSVNIVNPTLTVDTVSEYTAANGVTIDGVLLKDSKMNGSYITNASVNTAQLANASVTADKLSTGAATNAVATAEDTASATYVDLATSGPAVTTTIGANGLALVTLYTYIGNSTANSNNFMGFAISGATTVAASDAFATEVRVNDASIGGLDGASATFLVTGLSSGSNTFTAKYKVNAGTGRFTTRKITVIPL